MIDEIVLKLLRSFPGSFINFNGDFIAHDKDQYFDMKDRTETDLPDEPEINSAPIEVAEMIKPMDVNAQMDFVRVEKMESHRNGIDPYVKMHEEGKLMEAIKNQMLADNFCLQGSLSYHVKKVLAASNRVTKIELESDSETSEQTIERLKAENMANTEKRKKPRLATK